MRSSSLIGTQPIFFLVLQVVLALLFHGILIAYTHKMTKIGTIEKLLHPMNSSSTNLGRLMSLFCNTNDLSSPKMEAMVYALSSFHKEHQDVILGYKTSKSELVLITMTTGVFTSIFTFVLSMLKAAKRETHLRDALMEATKKAENKNLAYARAAHDIRAALSGIIGLIEISYQEVTSGSELRTNLRQMESCAKDILSLLNSILDISKIEAGKVKLDEEEFNLDELLEEVVDLFHPIGMRKGVDVVLDPHDGSVIKFSHVKGDRGKLKQILCNLLSNAVKFTSHGSVTIRAWVLNPGSENFIIPSNHKCYCVLQHFSWLFEKIIKSHNNIKAENQTVTKDPNRKEFVFEVNDTGKGIPKDKRSSVFQNYFQLNDGQGGTGLGLGIVQSLVRLMGGEIGIKDKVNDDVRGTRIRFNVFLTIHEANSSSDLRCRFIHQDNRLTSNVSPPCQRFAIGIPNSVLERSYVILLISSKERRRTLHKFMESLDVNIIVVNAWDNLRSTLKKLKSYHSPQNSFRRRDLSNISREDAKDVPLSYMEGKKYMLPLYKERGAPDFFLLVIDATAGPFSEVYKVVAEFRKGLQCICKVVWLDNRYSRSINLNELEVKFKAHPDDEIMLKPFHGSRLYNVIRLLSKSGGNLPPRRSESGSCMQKSEVEIAAKEDEQSHERSSSEKHKVVIRNNEGIPPIKLEEMEDKGSEKPLCGKRFLVVEDNEVLRILARSNLLQLGANVELCKNGEEALKLVCGGLQDMRDHQASHIILPYDYVLMDCQMPIMDGYEATNEIRKEESKFRVHIPIIALTADISSEEVQKTISNGMDCHLGKPFDKKHLLEAIKYIEAKK